MTTLQAKKAISKLIGRHTVGLCLAYRLCSDTIEEDRFAAYSGFIVKYSDKILFVTAGHVIRELEEQLNGDCISITSCAFADNLGEAPFGDRPVPFSIKGAQYAYIDDDAGIDIGFIIVRDIFYRLMNSNGIVPIAESNSIDFEADSIESFAIYGIPSQYVSDHLSNGNGVLEPTFISIPKCDPYPGHILRDENNRFSAGIKQFPELTSMRGMSGAPIFGFKLKDEIYYWLAAIQSSQSSTKNRIFATPAAILFEFLRTQFSTQKSELKKF